ncbi:hypothetical protein HMPREF3193_01201 [Bifidobacterium breve]|nr:hypothetical protein HMPREF3193_01201 [Bifidobacterium breve]
MGGDEPHLSVRISGKEWLRPEILTLSRCYRRYFRKSPLIS